MSRVLWTSVLEFFYNYPSHPLIFFASYCLVHQSPLFSVNFFYFSFKFNVHCDISGSVNEKFHDADAFKACCLMVINQFSVMALREVFIMEMIEKNFLAHNYLKDTYIIITQKNKKNNFQALPKKRVKNPWNLAECINKIRNLTVIPRSLQSTHLGHVVKRWKSTGTENVGCQ